MAEIFCPGAANIKGTPTLEVKTCPQCGGEIELFSTDVKRACGRCGFVAHNDLVSCVKWCQYARECVGDEMVDKLLNPSD
ncbi:MAG TPA: hypothetical protein DEB31_08485 [Clostridiales bacterium]|nr:hypothetical protein [Clostridiales bacterium]